MNYYACYTKLFETSLVFVRNFIIMVMLVKFETNSKDIYYKRIIFCRDDEYIVYRTNIVVLNIRIVISGRNFYYDQYKI